jgi:hypothetical protein
MSDNIPGSLTGNRRASLAGPKVVSVKVTMEGYLEKKSPKKMIGISAWQRRYFVLTVSSTDRGTHYKVLSYFKTAEDEEPLGNIPLIDVKAVNISKEKTGRFDVVIKGRTYMLRCDNATDLQNWVNALSSTQVKPAYAKPANLPSSPAEAMKLMAEASPEAAKLIDATDTLNMMKDGTAFIKYDYDSSTGDVDREIVLVFYKEDDGSELGSLYWCEPGEKQDVSQRALALHQLSDLYLGKQSKAFKHELAKSAPADRCFTACSVAGIEFHLEGDTKEQVAAWLFGINSIMMTRGNRKVTSVKKNQPANAAAGSSQPAEVSKSTSVSDAASASASTRVEEDEKEVQINTVNSLDDEAKPSSTPEDNGKFQEVKEWLTQLGPAFEAYFSAFRDNGIDMNFLVNLNDDDLEDLGVSVRLHRKKLLMAVDDIRIAKGMPARDEIIVGGSSGSSAAVPEAPSIVPAASAPSAPPVAPAGAPHSYTPTSAPANMFTRAVSLKSTGAPHPSSTSAGPEIVAMDAIMEGIRQAKLKRAGERKQAVEQKSEEPEFVQLLKKAQEAKKAKSERSSINLNGGTIAELAKKMAEERRQKRDAPSTGDAAPAPVAEAAEPSA